MESFSRWQIAIESCLVLFFCSAGAGCFVANRAHAEASGYIMAIGVPACAGAFFVALACFFSQVISLPRLAFPLPITLPVIYCSLLPVSALILATPERGLLAPQDTLSFARIWLNPLTLAFVFVCQALALSLFSAISRRGG